MVGPRGDAGETPTASSWTGCYTRAVRAVLLPLLLATTFACGDDGRPPHRDAGTDTQPSVDAAADAPSDAGIDVAPRDVGPRDSALSADAACAAQSVTAEVEQLPVDIIWMVDNSVSMQPAIEQVQAGLNDFATLISARDLDYRVIMLSLRGRGEASVGGGRRFQVCIPPPLAGDRNCGDGPRFFQVEVDVRSTQPLEQFLGTLGQTTGYLARDDRGSAPWRDLLRDGATKTLVIVSDDNSRLTADDFEHFAGGSNPFSSRELPPGILEPYWDGLFDDYVFSSIYGWGDPRDPAQLCTYPDGSRPPSSGPTYTTLVERTGGARGQICAAPTEWAGVFDDIATAVERRARIDCRIPIPPPPEGMVFERGRVNVLVTTDAGSEMTLGKVPSASACGTDDGWSYDDETAPAEVVLCPATCAALQDAAADTRRVDVQFGCQTLLI